VYEPIEAVEIISDRIHLNLAERPTASFVSIPNVPVSNSPQCGIASSFGSNLVVATRIRTRKHLTTLRHDDDEQLMQKMRVVARCMLPFVLQSWSPTCVVQGLGAAFKLPIVA
jgi:hypothetical protein